MLLGEHTSKTEASNLSRSSDHLFPGGRQLWPLLTHGNVIQLAEILGSERGFSSCVGSSTCAVQGIEAVGSSFENRPVFGESIFWLVLQSEQLGQHFACRNNGARRHGTLVHALF